MIGKILKFKKMLIGIIIVLLIGLFIKYIINFPSEVDFYLYKKDYNNLVTLINNDYKDISSISKSKINFFSGDSCIRSECYYKYKSLFTTIDKLNIYYVGIYQDKIEIIKSNIISDFYGYIYISKIYKKKIV